MLNERILPGQLWVHNYNDAYVIIILKPCRSNVTVAINEPNRPKRVFGQNSVRAYFRLVYSPELSR